MSLILEALKKSEAERRLGQAPDLLSPSPRLGSDDRARWPLRLAAGALLVLVAVAGWWWWRAPAATQPSTPPLATSTAEGSPETSAKAPPATAPDRAVPERAAPAEPTMAQRPAPAVQAPPRTRATPPERRVASATPPPSDPGFASVERESQAVAPGTLPQPPEAVPAPAEPAQPRIVDARPRPAPASAEPADAATLPRLRDLSPGEREALPPLQQSMHVFNDDPARRFVILDGRRHEEGARLSDTLVLVEIRRDGVVLELDGRRFLLPRPG